MLKGEILGEKENTVIRGPREGLRVCNTHFSLYDLHTVRVPFKRSGLLQDISVCSSSSAGNSANPTLPAAKPSAAALQDSTPSEGCTSHTAFTAQYEPATGGASKCQALKLLCQETNENISQWLQGSHLFPVFLLRLCSTILCSYKFSSCMASLQAHPGYLHTPTIFTRVLWRSKRQNQTKPCNNSVPEMVINPDSLLSSSFLLGRQCCLSPAPFNCPVTDFEK